MKSKLLCLLACLSLLVSCSEKGADAPVPAAICQLTEVRNKEGEELWQQPTYDTEGRPVSYLFNDSRVYAQFRILLTYDAAGRRKEMQSELLQNGWRGKTVYTYNDAGKTDSVYLYDYERGRDNSFAVYVHTYNQQDQLSEIRMKVLKDGQLQDRVVYLYFYEGNQLSRREDYEVGYYNFRPSIT